MTGCLPVCFISDQIVVNISGSAHSLSQRFASVPPRTVGKQFSSAVLSPATVRNPLAPKGHLPYRLTSMRGFEYRGELGHTYTIAA